MKKKDIEILSLKSSSHAQALHKEQQEAAEMRSAIASVESQRDSRAGNCERLRQQMEETQKLIKQRLGRPTSTREIPRLTIPIQSARTRFLAGLPLSED